MAVKKAVPDDDLKEYNQFEFSSITFRVNKVFKIGRFLRTLNSDPVGAIEIALDPQSFDLFLDLEMSMDDLKEFMELLSNTLSGTSSGN